MLTENLCMNCMEPMDNKKKCNSCGYVPKSQTESNYCLPEGHELNDQYTVGTLKGSGGFANTYIGYDKFFKEKVAIKEFLPSEFVSRTDSDSSISIKSNKYTEAFNTGKNNFLNEARILKDLKNVKGTVNVIGFFKANNTAYMVMELIEGETLIDYLERQPESRIEEKEAYRLLSPVVEILIQIHAKGLIHRDISPGNIIITKDGTAKLIDFGASREMITPNKSKTVIVKEGYTPPEQYTSQGNQGTWTDVYSFAATAYRTVTGLTPPDPFNRMLGEKLKTFEELGLNIINAEPTYKALELNINDRYRSMQELYDDLIKIDGIEEEPKPKPKQSKKKTALLAAIITALIVASIFVSAYFIRNSPKKAPNPTPESNESIIQNMHRLKFTGVLANTGHTGYKTVLFKIYNAKNKYEVVTGYKNLYLVEGEANFKITADILVKKGDNLTITAFIDKTDNHVPDKHETQSVKEYTYNSTEEINLDFNEWTIPIP